MAMVFDLQGRSQEGAMKTIMLLLGFADSFVLATWIGGSQES